MKRSSLLSALGILIGLTPACAVASPITYEFTGIASGTYGNKQFTDTAFQIDLLSSTTSVFTPLPGVIANEGVTTANIPGVASNVKVQNLTTIGFVNNGVSDVGIGYADPTSPVGETDLFHGTNSALASYDFTSNFALTPLVDIYNGFQSGVEINGKVLVVSEIASLNFSAVVSAVPLPASAPMFGAALLGLAGAGYAAKRRKAAIQS